MNLQKSSEVDQQFQAIFAGQIPVFQRIIEEELTKEMHQLKNWNDYVAQTEPGDFGEDLSSVPAAPVEEQRPQILKRSPIQNLDTYPEKRARISEKSPISKESSKENDFCQDFKKDISKELLIICFSMILTCNLLIQI